MTIRINTIDTLFDQQQTVAAIHIKNYLEWASGSEDYQKILAIPPIQRSFVWKPRQIQDLWDSLLRGMPIGSILLKEFAVGEKSGSVEPMGRQQTSSNKPGFHLMDGQQRTLSMLLGFPQTLTAEHKLWVDFSKPGKYGLQFRLRVTTATQPFGYQLDGRRLSMQDREDARKAWNLLRETNDEMTQREIFERAKPWKANGAHQGSLFEIKDIWQKLTALGMATWVQHAKTRIVESGGVVDEPVEARISSFGKGLNQLQSQWLALIKIPHIVQEELSDPEHDYLTMLFDRISSGGMRLRPDDLLFSMVKQQWSEAHNLVYKIQEKVGSMMEPTQFVMTAYRLAALHEPGIADDPKPGAKSFHKHVGLLLGSDEAPGTLRKMIGDNSLVNEFEKLKSLLEFKDDEAGDYGLPLAMFPYLDVPLLQVLLFWIRQRGAEHAVNPKVRAELVRFAMYWMVCNMGALSRREASKKAIELIKNNDNNSLFPGIEIYKALSEKDINGRSALFCPLSPPPVKSDASVLFHHPDERCSFYFYSNPQLYDCFSSKKAMLLWFQREWLHHQCTAGDFRDFKPLAGQDDDVVPYDFDHLVPQSNWFSLQRGAPRSGSELKKFENLGSRRTLGNSIGNYRVMSARDNRSRGHESLEKILPKAEIDREKWRPFVMECNEIDLDKWHKASPEKEFYHWGNERILAFQAAIESRTLYLYNNYYRVLGFDVWLN